jgi:Mitochondrial PGP phosphatase
MEYFLKHKDSGVTSPSQVAIVGDRLMTDMMMANTMGSYGVWVRNGVAESGRPPNLVGRFDVRWTKLMCGRYRAPKAGLLTFCVAVDTSLPIRTACLNKPLSIEVHVQLPHPDPLEAVPRNFHPDLHANLSSGLDLYLAVGAQFGGGLPLFDFQSHG